MKLKSPSTHPGSCKSVISCLWCLCCRWSRFTALHWALDETQCKEKWQPWLGPPSLSERQIASHMVPGRGETASAVWNPGICSPLVPDWSPAWHDTLFYYVTKLWFGSYDATRLPGITGPAPLKSSRGPLHRRVANVGPWIKKSQSRLCSKTRFQCDGACSVAVDRKREENEMCGCFEEGSKWNLCQSKAPLKNGSIQRVTAKWFGCAGAAAAAASRFLFLHFKDGDGVRSGNLKLPPSNKCVYHGREGGGEEMWGH